MASTVTVVNQSVTVWLPPLPKVLDTELRFLPPSPPATPPGGWEESRGTKVSQPSLKRLDAPQVDLFPPYPLFFREGWEAVNRTFLRYRLAVTKEDQTGLFPPFPLFFKEGWEAASRTFLKYKLLVTKEDQTGIHPPYPLFFKEGWEAVNRSFVAWKPPICKQDQTGIHPPFPLFFVEGWQGESARPKAPVLPTKRDSEFITLAVTQVTWGFGENQAAKVSAAFRRPVTDEVLFRYVAPVALVPWEFNVDPRRKLAFPMRAVVDFEMPRPIAPPTPPPPGGWEEFPIFRVIIVNWAARAFRRDEQFWFAPSPVLQPPCPYRPGRGDESDPLRGRPDEGTSLRGRPDESGGYRGRNDQCR